jgi:HSP20 family molecular chaperone IbpA
MIWKEDDQDLAENLKRNMTIGLLGFDELLNKLITIKGNASYPPYNIEKLSDNQWCIVLAVAGFAESDLEIGFDGMQLIIQGNKPAEDDDNRQYVYKGIATRSFKRSFLLAEGIQVAKADIINGLLKILIIRPQSENKTIKIPINNKENKSNIIYSE